MDIQDVLKTNYVQDLIEQTCGKNTELVTRQDCFAVRSSVEGDRNIYRVLLMPPRGFTANEINQMNSHDEADFATIEIKGAVRINKSAFSKLKDCLLVASKDENGSVSELTHPYLTFDMSEQGGNELTLKKHSSGLPPFPVVKNDGFGFYHNLINLTDDWLVLKLHKRLRPNKPVELDKYLKNLNTKEAEAVLKLYNAVEKYGDGVFKHAPEAVQQILNLPVEVTLPPLGEMLFIHDSGMHEACTVFGIILKLAQNSPNRILEFLDNAIENNSIPLYYAKQLIGKINKRTVQNNNYTPELSKAI